MPKSDHLYRNDCAAMGLAQSEPQPTHDIFVIAASRGGVEAFRRIVKELPSDLEASLFIVLHIGRHHSQLDWILNQAGTIPATQARHCEEIKQHHIYVAPADHHMQLHAGKIYLDKGPKVHYARPAADPLFNSAAEAFGSRVVGIVLTGGDGDGARGLVAIKEAGGIAIVQDPKEAQVPDMPESSLLIDHPDYCVYLNQIPQLMVTLSRTESHAAA